MTPDERRIAQKVIKEFKGGLRGSLFKRMKPEGYKPDNEGDEGSNPDSPDDPGDADDITDKEFAGAPTGRPKEAMPGQGDEGSPEEEATETPGEEDDEEMMMKLKEYRSSLGK